MIRTILVVGALSVLLGVSTAESATICVKADHKKCEETLADGIAQARSGDTVEVRGGAYEECVVIPAGKVVSEKVSTSPASGSVAVAG